jgi:predicted O-methyltransferase YrrM
MSVPTMIKTVAQVAIREPRDLVNTRRWLQARGKDPLELRFPWMPFRVVDLLAEYLDPGARVFEYGGGGSTAWFNDQGCEVTTVENHPFWAEELGRVLNSTVIYEPLEGSPEGYVGAIDRFEDESLDVVLVDGHERVSCCRRAMSKVKPGGLLLLDDSWRSWYDEAKDAVCWPRRELTGYQAYVEYVSSTAIFTRPGD